MTIRRRFQPRVNRRRGGVLFEVMLSVALFVGAAAFVLGATRSVFTTLDRTRLQREALDLARSRLAELEAGLINLADLRGENSDAGSFAEAGAPRDGDHPDGQSQWTFDLKTSRSEFTGLSLVELTVIEDLGSAIDSSGAAPMRVTLRQLMSLREMDEEGFEQDEIMEGAR
jgi:hypothetical protein